MKHAVNTSVCAPQPHSCGWRVSNHKQLPPKSNKLFREGRSTPRRFQPCLNTFNSHGCEVGAYRDVFTACPVANLSLAELADAILVELKWGRWVSFRALNSQGCELGAYKDVFTACPVTDSPPPTERSSYHNQLASASKKSLAKRCNTPPAL